MRQIVIPSQYIAVSTSTGTVGGVRATAAVVVIYYKLPGGNRQSLLLACGVGRRHLDGGLASIISQPNMPVCKCTESDCNLFCIIGHLFNSWCEEAADLLKTFWNCRSMMLH